MNLRIKRPTVGRPEVWMVSEDGEYIGRLDGVLSMSSEYTSGIITLEIEGDNVETVLTSGDTRDDI